MVPAVELILRRDRKLGPRDVGALIISPTRELARQTHAVCAHFSACSEGALAPPLLITGGGAVSDDLAKVAAATAAAAKTHARPSASSGESSKSGQSAHGLPLVVATPGRLDDLLSRYELFGCKELELLVLDEADTLLNMGFRPQITSILGRLPKQRRTGLFSATQTR